MSSTRGCNLLSKAIDRLALLLGLANIGLWTYMTIHGGNECQYFFDNPILLFAFLLFMTWLFKFISRKYFSSTRIHTVSAIVMLALIFAVFSSVLFAFIVISKTKNEFGNFKRTAWLPKYVIKSMYQHGDRPAKCVSGVCQAFERRNLSVPEFKKILTKLPLELGCCSPPSHCCKQYKNATFWENDTRFCHFGIRDLKAEMLEECTRWKNDHTTLCYSCNTCLIKIAIRAKKLWRHLVVLNIYILVLTIILSCNDYCRVWRKKNNVPMKSGLELSPN